MTEKRRRPGTGSCIEVAPGVWDLYPPGGFDPISGRRYRPKRRFHGDDVAAERELDRLCILEGRVSGSSMELWDFIEHVYLPAIEPPELRRMTVEGYRMKLDRYLKPSSLARKRLDRLTRLDMVTWMRWVKSQVPNKQHQLNIYSAASAMFGRAHKWGLLSENILRASVDPPEPDEYIPRPLTEAQANDYLDAFDGHELEAFVTLMIAFGPRPSEGMAVDWRSDFDWAEGTVTFDEGIHQRRVDGEMKVWYEDTKSRKSKRTVAGPDWAMERLKQLRGIGRITGDLRPGQVAYRYKKHVEACGLPWCPIEELRHTNATILSERGVSWEDNADYHGHSSPKMLKERYVKIRTARSKMVAGAMDGVRREQRRGSEASG